MAYQTIRTFLAIELSEALKKETYLFVETLRDRYQGFRFIEPQNWHLTLHFLGDIEPEKIEQLGSRLKEALVQINPFSVSLEGLGVFPNSQRPRILWIGVSGDISELLTLKKQVDEVLQNMHFQIETRPFHPHITIARAREGSKHSYLISGQTFKAQRVDEIHSLTLFKSDLSPRGAQHTPLQVIPFSNP